MQDDLQKAYTAYQQALYHLPNPKVRGVAPFLSLFFITTRFAGRPEVVVRDRYPL
jgi:hypothetical protein